MEIEGKVVPSCVAMPVWSDASVSVQRRIDELSRQKVLLQTELERLEKEGSRSIPSICSECPFLEAGKSYTVGTLSIELFQLFSQVKREEKKLEEQFERCCSGSALEKHFSDLSISPCKKGKIEDGSAVRLDMEGVHDSGVLSHRLRWAEDEKTRLESALEALHGVRHTAEDLDKVASEVGMMGQASIADIYRHVGSRISSWTEQIRFIENKLKTMQKGIVEEQMCQAIDREDIDLVLRLNKMAHVDCNLPLSVKGGGFTPLTYAIDAGKVKMVLFFLDTLHVNPNQIDQSNDLYQHGLTPLLRAIARGDERIIDFLLQRDVFVDLPAGDLLPITYAITLGRSALALKLMRAPNVNLNRWAPGGMGPFQAAIAQEDISLIRALQEAGAEVNSLDGTGASPLTYALSQGKREVASELLRLGADSKRPDRLGRVPEHMF